MRNLLLPRSDHAVLVQALVVFPVLLAAIFVARHDREWRLLLIGVFTMTLAFFGLRSIH